MSQTTLLRQIAERIEHDEDFAMRVGEDPRGALEAEGLPDALIARVLHVAGEESVRILRSPDDVRATVSRVAAAARKLAQDPAGSSRS